mgnify:FL=1
MRFIYNDIELNLNAGVLIKNGQTISIRAKTLLVLKYLIANQDKVVNKQEILASVWHDVIVQEQVLVQSIKEIRDLLGSHVIKTYPRQGYQWTAELEEIADTKKTQLTQKPLLIASSLIIFIVLALVSLYSLISKENSTDLNDFSVIFLPVVNDMPDDIHDWVPLQGMDYLSKTLSQNSQLTVLNHTQSLTQLDNFNHIAQKLNSNLVVQTKLLGYPQDFQLHYSLHLLHSVERGIIFSKTVGEGFDQLVQTIAQRFDQFTPKQTQPYISDFSNEAFARGIEHYLQRQYPQAINFFSSALQSNNNLLAARRYLAASQINQGNAEQGIALMKENIEQAQDRQDQREEIRSSLMIGVLLINWYEESSHSNQNTNQSNNQTLDEAEHYIQVSKNLAEKYQDALFTAYAYEELAKIKRLQKDYEQAKKLLNQALSFYQGFRSDYGKTRALIELALIAHAQHDNKQADTLFSQATEIANKNGVTTNKVAILLAQAQVLQSQDNDTAAQQYTQQALTLAKEAGNNLLIARVEAWLANNPRYEIN